MLYGQLVIILISIPHLKPYHGVMGGVWIDSEKHLSNSKDIDEKLKIIDLLLGTQYWH